MDSMIAAAAQALAMGDLLGALKRVALRDDAPALALRGIAMAQLGDLARARELLQQAARAFGPREAVPRARCVVAEAEIALVLRDLGWRPEALAAARSVLESHGDRVNAAQARHIQARRALLIGRLDEAADLLADGTGMRLAGSTAQSPGGGAMPAAVCVGYELVAAGIAMRRLRSGAAHAALVRARRAAERSGIPPLLAEVASAWQALEAPVARLMAGDGRRLLRLADVEALTASGALIVDACRGLIGAPANRAATADSAPVHLARRPVLFALARQLAEAWPNDVPRRTLIAAAFRGKHADDSYRARLRVEIGRLRSEISALAGIRATKDGFQLHPHAANRVHVIAPLEESDHATLLALLSDGEAWSSSALSIALDTSPRTVQRALEALASAGKVHSFGRGPARRWTIPSIPGFPSILLLPNASPGA